MSETTTEVPPVDPEHFDFEITEGGVLISLGAEEGLDLTTPNEDPDKIQANIATVKALLEKLGAAIPAILQGLEDLAAETGRTCDVCKGEREIAFGHDGSVRCERCDATGRTYPAAIAA